MVEIKGSVVGDSIRIIKARYGEEAYASILGHLRPEARTKFDRGSVMPMDWYMLDDFVEFLEMDLKVTANGNEKELIRRSEELIGQQLAGIYKAFIKLGSPGFLLSRLAIVNQTYFRGVSVELEQPSPGNAIVRLTGFEKQHRLIGFTILGFYQEALNASGAKDIMAEFTTRIEEDKGYCELTLNWKGG